MPCARAAQQADVAQHLHCKLKGWHCWPAEARPHWCARAGARGRATHDCCTCATHPPRPPKTVAAVMAVAVARRHRRSHIVPQARQQPIRHGHQVRAYTCAHAHVAHASAFVWALFKHLARLARAPSRSASAPPKSTARHRAPAGLCAARMHAHRPAGNVEAPCLPAPACVRICVGVRDTHCVCVRAGRMRRLMARPRRRPSQRASRWPCSRHLPVAGAEGGGGALGPGLHGSAAAAC